MRSRSRGLPAALLLAGAAAAHAQISGTADVDLSQKSGNDSECAVSKNPANPDQLFALCNSPGPGLLASRSTDGGATWIYPDPADKTIGDGDAGQGPTGCCDPTLAWDAFGNLYVTYLNASIAAVITLLSTDGGATFTNLATFVGSVDQATVVAESTTAPGAPVAVWLVWNQAGAMVARGAPVTGPGAPNVGPFTPLQSVPVTNGCSFGDVAISPGGSVVQVCGPTSGQGGGSIRVNVDLDGLGPGNFGLPVIATTTNVGGFDYIPAQPNRSVDPEAGLAFDRNPASPHYGRLYLVYTEETADENNDLDIMLRFSDDVGATWSPPLRVNDDPPSPIRSQFNPRLRTDPVSGNILVCWHDCRESATNTAMREYCAAAPANGPVPGFLANAPIGDGLSISSDEFDFGDYSGLDYVAGAGHPIWGDSSNSTGNNPNGTSNFDTVTDTVTGSVPVRILDFTVE